MAVWVVAALMLVMIVGIDLFSGPQLSLSLFYVLPITLVTWRFGVRAGSLASAIAAVVWVTVNVGSRTDYSHLAIPLWNGVIRFGFFLTITHLQGSQQRALEAASQQARVDPLTSLSNRRHFTEMATYEIERARRNHTAITLAYLDIDEFKAVNDDRGHAEGDAILRRTGEVLRNGLRSIDVVGRLGGDEFGIVLPDTEEFSARAAFKRVHEDLVAAGIRASIGVITFIGRTPHLDEALELVDEVMYLAKSSGKSQVAHRTLTRTPG